MNDDERIDQDSALGTNASMPSKSYSFLLGLSKKLGTVATKSFVEVREFLNKDVPLPSSERFLSNMPHLKHKHAQTTSKLPDVEKSEETRNAKTGVDPSQKLERIVKESHEVLAGAKTVFPVTLFPDTVFVDRTKVTIVRRSFFWSEDIMSIRIQDVLNVSASVGPLFGSLTIVSRVMSTVDHFQINYFWRSDASHLKHIIQGYVIAKHNKLDTAHLNKDELVKTLEELGHDSGTGN